MSTPHGAPSRVEPLHLVLGVLALLAPTTARWLIFGTQRVPARVVLFATRPLPFVVARPFTPAFETKERT